MVKAVILDGSKENDKTGARVLSATVRNLRSRGFEVECASLHEKTIGNCAGDFFCWIRSPGICNVDDDNRDIAQSIANSDLMVYLTPITFGGYSSILKKAVDHQIQNISPFFTRVNGETHHQKRYAKYPDFLAIGWMDNPDEAMEKVFRHLTWRNTLNFYAKRAATGVVLSNHTDAEIQLEVERGLKSIQMRSRPQPVQLPKLSSAIPEPREIQRAVLLVGSPRTRKSTSHSLGAYLFERLQTKSIETKTIFLHTVLRSPERMKALLDSVDNADLVLMAFPLYVDSLPAPVTEALERIAAARSDQTSRGLFAAIANCGYPEPEHNATALAICATFAHQAGFVWAGSLALGAGEGMVHGTPIHEMDGRAAPLKQALELAAEALASGRAIPQEAQDLWAKPFIPAWLYRLAGVYGWRRQARRWGAERLLKRQPYVQP